MSANNLKCFHCPDCSKEFSKEKTLIKHFKVHSSGKSYRCKMCYSVYPSKRQYNEHKKTHLENEYSTCSECEKQVLKTSLSRKCCDECNLKPKKYLCEKCGKAYDSLMGVRFHIQKGKHSTLFSQCFSCGLTFQSNMALFFHLTQHPDFNIRIVEASEENVEYSGSKSGNLEIGNRSLHLKLTKPSKMTYPSQEEENGKTNNKSSTQASMSRDMTLQPPMILADKTEEIMKMPSTVAQQGVESIDRLLTLNTKVGQERAAGEHYINLQVMSRMNNMLPAEKMQGVPIEGNSVGQQAFVPNNTAFSSCHVTLPQERVAGQVSVLQDNSAAHTSIPSWNMIGLDNAISQEKKVLEDETLMMNSDKCRSSKPSGIPQEINLTQYGLTNWKREWQQNGFILQDNSAPLQVCDRPQNSKDTRGILNQEERLIYEKMFGSELNMERNSSLERTFTQVQNIIKDQAGVQDKMTLQHGWTNDYCNALFNGMYAEKAQLHQRMKMGNTVAVKDKITEEHFLLDFEVKKNNELGIHTIKEGDIREKNEVLLLNEKGITEENSIQNRHSKRGSKQLQNAAAFREFEPDYDQASWTKSTVQAENGSQMYHHKLTKNAPLEANKIFSQNMRHDLLLVSDIKNETLLMYKLWLERKKGAAKDSERQEECSNNFLEMLNLGSEEKQKLKLNSNPTKNYLTNSHNFDIRSSFHVGIQCANNENSIFSMADKNVCDQFGEKWSTIPLQNSIVTGGVNVEDYINHLMWH
ncbi:uncharacterized protein [Procambarus clarkii]|uniref:uncharacterized protein n=1 Tax=Procambarus clarkii TaxID=6728 RepID=UPI001E675A49|nr:RE1-silencing transcription factor-like [Procambarus clarkii]XP_045595482.1 RE1-silencing transcription factor-like [Procambarus clarkii]XP_045595483.1 RE1-silencing transcription factor-like [Procambarus clarkii]XP_045595484.1 RE1-silencing transcription factor-like [Procambarus clarkii]